ncbi:hypothetical protein [Aneurinibacillus terranovensis]|uniref:hypothetical protein n=1 Tax=Aneurinibacillus terranovensis TaxID=278991 RepID=UPI0012DE1C37|nr:hypothetical protein [Aneurinibacillus terranovensis]
MTGRSDRQNIRVSQGWTIVGLIALPATRSTSKKQRSAHSREFFSGDQWKKVYVALIL